MSKHRRAGRPNVSRIWEAKRTNMLTHQNGSLDAFMPRIFKLIWEMSMGMKTEGCRSYPQCCTKLVFFLTVSKMLIHKEVACFLSFCSLQCNTSIRSKKWLHTKNRPPETRKQTWNEDDSQRVYRHVDACDNTMTFALQTNPGWEKSAAPIEPRKKNSYFPLHSRKLTWIPKMIVWKG